MDFLDPLYNRRHIRRLYTGYALVAIAIVLAVTMLLLIAYGFQLNKEGKVIQNGLLFASSKPEGVNVYIDGINSDKLTNTRMNLPEGSYELELKRSGYRNWQHRVEIIGGKILRYDYPLLIPETLTTTTLQTLTAKAPGIVTVTPDKRWLLLQQDSMLPKFAVVDLKNTDVPQAAVSLPDAVYTAGGKQTWELVSWASDKKHALIRHGYGTKKASEYILFNRDKPQESVNLSTTLAVEDVKITFIDSKFDRYYLYDTADQTLRSATLTTPTLRLVLSDVLAFDTFKASKIVYVAASENSKATTVPLRLKDGDQDVLLGSLPKAKAYHIALAEYSGATYVAAANDTTGKTAIYKNPLAQLAINRTVRPQAQLRMPGITYLAFSAGGRFVLAENGTKFADYDLEYKVGVHYTMPQPLDKGQSHAVWMDGAHLQYVSNKQLYVFDHDGTNSQLLVPAVHGEQVFYDTDFRFVYALAPPATAKGNYVLTSTPLRTTEDL